MGKKITPEDGFVPIEGGFGLIDNVHVSHEGENVIFRRLAEDEDGDICTIEPPITINLQKLEDYFKLQRKSTAYLRWAGTPENMDSEDDTIN